MQFAILWNMYTSISCYKLLIAKVRLADLSIIGMLVFLLILAGAHGAVCSDTQDVSIPKLPESSELVLSIKYGNAPDEIGVIVPRKYSGEGEYPGDFEELSCFDIVEDGMVLAYPYDQRIKKFHGSGGVKYMSGKLPYLVKCEKDRNGYAVIDNTTFIPEGFMDKYGHYSNTFEGGTLQGIRLDERSFGNGVWIAQTRYQHNATILELNNGDSIVIDTNAIDSADRYCPGAGESFIGVIDADHYIVISDHKSIFEDADPQRFRTVVDLPFDDYQWNYNIARECIFNVENGQVTGAGLLEGNVRSNFDVHDGYLYFARYSQAALHIYRMKPPHGFVRING